MLAFLSRLNIISHYLIKIKDFLKIFYIIL